MLIYFQTQCRTRYSLAIKLLYFNLLNLRDSYFIPVVSKMVNSPMIKVFKSLNLFYLRYNITAYTCMFPQRVPKRGGGVQKSSISNQHHSNVFCGMRAP